ncbi:MAG: hypothetical protein K0S74_614 [Chlamydiales bacterium]|jgi:hypothetical protein|nr:hypothetical protein [Chlamydiales bacterium]
MTKDNQHLTTEHLSRRFDNVFDLVTHSIKVARNKIKAGRACRVNTNINNEACQVLEEVAVGQDFLEEIDYKARKKRQEEERQAQIELAKSRRAHTRKESMKQERDDDDSYDDDDDDDE